LTVPLREIALDASSGEPPVPVYDPSGAYTDPNATIDVERGLPRTRLAWVQERGGVAEYDGRPVQPVDNGNATGKHLARNFAHTPKPLRASSSPSPLAGKGATSSPSPLVGEGGEGGREATHESGRVQILPSSPANDLPTPTPNPSPQGGGEHAEGTSPQQHPLTQLEWARAGVITKEMIYIAEREN